MRGTDLKIESWPTTPDWKRFENSWQEIHDLAQWLIRETSSFFVVSANLFYINHEEELGRQVNYAMELINSIEIYAID